MSTESQISSSDLIKRGIHLGIYDQSFGDGGVGTTIGIFTIHAHIEGVGIWLCHIIMVKGKRVCGIPCETAVHLAFISIVYRPEEGIHTYGSCTG